MTTTGSGAGGVERHISLLTLPHPKHQVRPAAGLAIHRRAFAAAVTAGPAASAFSLLGGGTQISSTKLHGADDGGQGGCLEFHPHLLQLASCSPDGSVCVHSLRRTY